MSRKKMGGNLVGKTLCGEGVSIGISPGMGGRVILAGKSEREKTIWWHIL